jgi:hypothetical protein
MAGLAAGGAIFNDREALVHAIISISTGPFLQEKTLQETGGEDRK